MRFNADQVTCLCEAQQQAGDLDRLARFISSLEPTELAAGGESVLRARAAVAFHQGRYTDLFTILEGHHFEPAGHPWLQQMWYRAHYAEAEKARGRPLGQYTIVRSEDTHYCSRALVVLLLSFFFKDVPSSVTIRLI